jgi:hypothetical protein
MKLFDLSDIKAGYLIRCTDLREDQNGRKFNMTVIPCRRIEVPFLALGFPQTKETYLACCNKGRDWLPLSGFGPDLIHANSVRIDEVWGCTSPMQLMDNVPVGRECLWKRDDTKRMTLEEIGKALGHKVEVVERVTVKA